MKFVRIAHPVEIINILEFKMEAAAILDFQISILTN